MKIAVAGGTGVVGRYAVAAATTAGHEVVSIARSKGVDVFTGEGLEAALVGVDAIIDTLDAPGTEEAAATDFFTTAIGNLHRFGSAAGVSHLVVLSIVGIDDAPTDYYRAKLAQEAAARAGVIPVTIQRTTQFHEFPAQVLTGTTAYIPDHRVQTVAARTVGHALIELATEPAMGAVADLGGPEEASLPTLARRYVEALGIPIAIEVVPSEIPARVLVPTYGSRLAGPTFGQWLTSNDARTVAPVR